MSLFEISNLVKELGCDLENATIYRRMPDCDLDGGLREVKSDRDVVDMFEIHKEKRIIPVYLENIRVPLDVNELGIMRGDEKEESDSESENDGSEISERTINSSVLEYFADKDEIINCTQLDVTSKKLSNENVSVTFEMGSGSGRGQHIHLLTYIDRLRDDPNWKVSAMRKAAKRDTQWVHMSKILKTIEELKVLGRNYDCTYAGNYIYEVRAGERTFIVDLGNHTCLCRRWDLTGVPCAHVISAIIQDKRQPDLFVHPYYHKETYILSYASIINPIPDDTQ
ncbi:hypothetical protein Vadar_029108 [Vaccinium darrowii]|uniref:Uncharacterized protein n=1 Tax=Vaccinium darrowii TaxID=229202 RepID=A0ACB7Y9P8_9ERIC|nr:hypothetical protein Vadar_029108 [Vaccinium darrowii]